MTASAGSTPLVVLLLPTFNSQEFVQPTLDSLAAQTYPNFKVLISDDSSSDHTLDICERHAASDDRFSVIRQPRNLGWVGNLNALQRAVEPTADFVVFASHDDLLAPTYSARLAEVLVHNPNAVLAHTDMDVKHLDGSIERWSYDELDGVTCRMERARRILRRKGQWWVPYRGMFRSSPARGIDGLKRHMAGEFSADWPWLLRLSLLGEFVRVAETLYDKNYRSNSASADWRFDFFQWRAVELSCLREIHRSEIGASQKISLYREMAAQKLARVAPRSDRRESAEDHKRSST